MELQKQQNQLVNTTISIDLAKQLYHVNYIISFPLNDSVIEGWSRCIEELEPEITPEVIKWIIDRVKIGLIDWDNKKGVQNIFEGFRKYIDFKINDKEGNPDYCNKNNKWNILYIKYRKRLPEHGIL